MKTFINRTSRTFNGPPPASISRNLFTSSLRKGTGKAPDHETYGGNVQANEINKGLKTGQASKEGDEEQQSGTLDAIKASKGPGRPDTKQKRGDHTDASSGGFQPGQSGEQVGGHGPSSESSAGGKEEAAPEGIFDGVKNLFKSGKRSFHTSTNASGRPYWEQKVPSYNVDPGSSHITASESSPRAVFTYVRGYVEPDSYQRYDFVPPPAPNDRHHGLPSSHAPRPSTATGAAHPKTAEYPQNESGIGSSSKVFTAKQGVEIMTEEGTVRPSATKDHKTKIPPDFDTEVRGKWSPSMDKAQRKNERPPEGKKASFNHAKKRLARSHTKPEKGT